MAWKYIDLRVPVDAVAAIVEQDRMWRVSSRRRRLVDLITAAFEGRTACGRRRRGRQQHAVDDVHDAVARLNVRRHDRDAIHKDAIAVDLEAQLEAGKRLDAEAVREVLRKHLARNGVVQQDGLELLRLEQLLGRDAQFADQGQKVLILGGEDTGVGLGSELR